MKPNPRKLRFSPSIEASQEQLRLLVKENAQLREQLSLTQDKLQRLIKAFDKMAPSRIACDGMLLIPADRFNAVVKVANGG